LGTLSVLRSALANELHSGKEIIAVRTGRIKRNNDEY
jgi:hypothetical protein